jgi:AcrR family transcriptional regulator
MARTPDEHLKDRILDVAQGLLRAEGPKGITLRAVADAAGTTTPTVYKRFPDKTAILLALALRARQRYVKRQSQRKSLLSAAEGYLDWAIENPHEYQLVYGPYWTQVFAIEMGRPGLDWTQAKLADLYGGEPQEYELMGIALWMLLHGAASLLSQQPTGKTPAEIRRKCLAACDRLLENPNILRHKDPRKK